VFDVTRRETFRNVKKWVEEIKAEGNSNVVLVLIANKIDLTTERVVQKAEGQKLARESDMIYVETSAKCQ